jgi:exopolyphosphatase/guanosine-5'-triphosphate,3'-diphosphate pyrophosphatase
VESALQGASFALHMLCLRLAVIVCNARNDVEADAVTLRVVDGVPVVRLRAGWADAHPRALHLLRAEIDAWSKTGLAQQPRLVVTADRVTA